MTAILVIMLRNTSPENYMIISYVVYTLNTESRIREEHSAPANTQLDPMADQQHKRWPNMKPVNVPRSPG